MDDDRVFTLSLVSNDLSFSPDVDTAATRTVRLNDAGTPSDDGTRWKIWPRYVPDQVIDL